MVFLPPLAAQRGFTLIELLVVISIIALLSSVALASLSAARNKAADSNIKANLAGIRAESEIFYDIGQTYTGACATSGTGVIGDSVTAADKVFDNSAPTYALATASTASDGQCHVAADGKSWAAEVPLKGGSNFCVDSTGKAITTATLLLANIAVCS